MRRTVRAGFSGVFGLGVLTLVTGQAIAGPTTEFTVTGDVVSPAIYDQTGLGSLPPTTETLRVFGCLPGAGARGCTEAGVRKASRGAGPGAPRS
jgi:hypothetical protein